MNVMSSAFLHMEYHKTSTVDYLGENRLASSGKLVY